MSKITERLRAKRTTKDGPGIKGRKPGRNLKINQRAKTTNAVGARGWEQHGRQ